MYSNSALMLVFFVVSLRIWFFYAHFVPFTNGQPVDQTVRIVSEPYYLGKQQRFALGFSDGKEVWVTTQKEVAYTYGSLVHVSGTVLVQPGSQDEFLSIRYPRLVQISNDTNYLLAAARAVRLHTRHLYENVLSPIHAALLAGIVLGVKIHLPAQTADAFRSAGVTHVIAASGMNVAIVIGACVSIFGKLAGRKWALVLSLGAVIFYGFLSGFEASILRASFMGGITLFAGMLGRQKTATYALFLTAAILLGIWPYLFTDIGFQLSLFATAGILFIKPFFQSFEHIPVIGDDFTTTLAAQLSTFPLLLFHFGEVNVLSLLVNILILWTVPFLMAIGAAAIIISSVFLPLAEIILFLAYPLLWYFMAVITWAQHIPVFLKSLPLPFYFAYYCFLCAVYVKKRV